MSSRERGPLNGGGELFLRYIDSKQARLADGVGFEPTVSVNPRRFSRPVP